MVRVVAFSLRNVEGDKRWQDQFWERSMLVGDGQWWWDLVLERQELVGQTGVICFASGIFSAGKGHLDLVQKGLGLVSGAGCWFWSLLVTFGKGRVRSRLWWWVDVVWSRSEQIQFTSNKISCQSHSYPYFKIKKCCSQLFSITLNN